MKVDVKEIKSLSVGAFEAVERFVGSTLNSSIKIFFERFNGGKPGLNVFEVGSNNDSGVNKFISVEELVLELERFDFKEGFIPIAWAEGGNYVAARLTDGRVYFVDHEVSDCYIELSKTIDGFLDGLRSAPIDSVVLAPGQVIKAWVNHNPIRTLKSKP